MLWRLRRYIRKNYKPVSQEQARLYKEKLSITYAFIGWNLFAYLIYMGMRNTFPKENTAVEFAQFLNVQNATVVKYDGLTKLDEFEVHVKDTPHHVDYFSELYGEDIKYYKYLDEDLEEEEK